MEIQFEVNHLCWCFWETKTLQPLSDAYQGNGSVRQQKQIHHMSCRCWIALICEQSSSSVSYCSLLPRENKGTICEAKELSSTRETYSCKFTPTGFYNYVFSCIKTMLGWDSAQDSTQCDCLLQHLFKSVLMWIWTLATKTKAEERKEKERKDP